MSGSFSYYGKQSSNATFLQPAPQTSNMDQIEMAFRKFDVNRDGYLSREEFDEVCILTITMYPIISLATFKNYGFFMPNDHRILGSMMQRKTIYQLNHI